MLFFVGLVILFGSILGGYMPHGDLRVLYQPLEFLIIMGAALGAFIISNPKPVIMGVLKRLSRVLKGPPHDKVSYLQLLTLLYAILRLLKAKGSLAIEEHFYLALPALMLIMIKRRPQAPRLLSDCSTIDGRGTPAW